MFTLLRMPMFLWAPDEGAGGGVEAPTGDVGTPAPAPEQTPPDPTGEASTGQTGDPAAGGETGQIDWSKIDPKSIPEDIAEQLALEKSPEWFGRRLAKRTEKATEALRTEIEDLKAKLGQYETQSTSQQVQDPEPAIDPITQRYPELPAQTAELLSKYEQLTGEQISGVDLAEREVNVAGPGETPEMVGFATLKRMVQMAEASARSQMEAARTEQTAAAAKLSQDQERQQVMDRANQVDSQLNTSLQSQMTEAFKGIDNADALETYRSHLYRTLTDQLAGHIVDTGEWPDEETINGYVSAEVQRYAKAIFAPYRKQEEVNAEARTTAPVTGTGQAGTPGPVDERSMTKAQRRAYRAEQARIAMDQTKRQAGMT